jgi:hypothetical protein
MFPHKRRISLEMGHDETVRVWDAKTGQSLHTLQGHTDYVSSVAFSPTEDRLASASRDKTGRVWDMKTGRLLYRLEGHESFVNSVAFSPTGDRLASDSFTDTVWVWDAKTGQLLHTLKGHKNWAASVVFSGDGLHLEIDQGLMLLPPPTHSTSAIAPQLPAKWIFVAEAHQIERRLTSSHVTFSRCSIRMRVCSRLMCTSDGRCVLSPKQ